MRKPRGPDPDTLYDGPSKSQVKREMTELQDMSIALLELPDAQLDEIEMEDTLRTALRQLRPMRHNEARRRQAQYVGKLMRAADAAPLKAAIDAHRLGTTRAAREFQGIELWRDRLIASDEGLTAWMAEFPASDTQQLRALIRNARREAALAPPEFIPEGRAPKGRAYRELFQRLRSDVAAASALRNDAPPAAL